MSTSSAPSSGFSETLSFITSLKLQELEKQSKAYKAHAAVLEQARVETNLVERVEILLKAVRAWSGSGAIESSDSVVGAKLDLENLDLWLLQAKSDPSFSPDVLNGWAQALEDHVKHLGTRFEYARLFGNLLSEWLSSGDSSTPQAKTEDARLYRESFNEWVSSKGGESPVAEPVLVGRNEMHEQRGKLESIIFEPKNVDVPGIRSYLDALFAEQPETPPQLDIIRQAIAAKGTFLLRHKIASEDIKWVITSLLKSNLMSEGKRTTLKEFTNSPVILEEVASVLNMRLAGVEQWGWPAEGMVMEMRRELNGHYRAFTDPEILDALLLEYLGRSWQVAFKTAFKGLASSKAWKPSAKPTPASEAGRRSAMLKESTSGASSIEASRVKMRNSSFLCGQLSDTVNQRPVYGEWDDGDSEGEGDLAVSNDVRQKILHILATESLLNKAVHGTHQILRTDMAWFGPSLAHDTILTVLEFFGLPKQWISFFAAFLKTPLRLQGEDTSRVRSCGTPISYAMSALCGEVVLFVMDFAVNQRADGLFLYRNHDDLWLWDNKPDRTVAAWKEMNGWADLAGLTFNMEKTGSAFCGGELDPSLPTGDVRWGFLKFDPEKARFAIDQADIDTHIAELRRQLKASKSVFGWINGMNQYMAFLIRNFGGRPAVCLGQEHVDDMVYTLARVQSELFPKGAVGWLRETLAERFNVVDELPQGYFYVPIKSGGLELVDYMVKLFALRRALADPGDLFSFERTIERDTIRYQMLKESWEYKTPNDWSDTSRVWEGEPFLSFEDYVAGRECGIHTWNDIYMRNMSMPAPAHVRQTPAIRALLAKGTSGNRAEAVWNEMGFYEKWTVSMYGEALVEKFGSLEAVDPTLIPVGMVELFRSSRTKWEQ